MTYRFDDQFIGYPPIEAVVPVPAVPPFGLPISPGFCARAEDPVWGPGEFVFARAGAGIPLLQLCTFLPVWDATNKVYTYNMTVAPASTTAGIGRPLYVYQGSVALTTGQYGWFMTSGRSPVSGNITFPTADVAVFRATATGQVTPTAVAGGQILNARVITPSTQTVVSAGSGLSGDTRINLASTSGFFVGGYVSGTNVGVAAIVSKVDPLGKFILVTVANSGAVSGNITITYNNATIFYPVVEFNRVGGQGQIA